MPPTGTIVYNKGGSLKIAEGNYPFGVITFSANPLDPNFIGNSSVGVGNISIANGTLNGDGIESLTLIGGELASSAALSPCALFGVSSVQGLGGVLQPDGTYQYSISLFSTVSLWGFDSGNFLVQFTFVNASYFIQSMLVESLAGSIYLDQPISPVAPSTLVNAFFTFGSATVTYASGSSSPSAAPGGAAFGAGTGLMLELVNASQTNPFVIKNNDTAGIAGGQPSTSLTGVIKTWTGGNLIVPPGFTVHLQQDPSDTTSLRTTSGAPTRTSLKTTETFNLVADPGTGGGLAGLLLGTSTIKAGAGVSFSQPSPNVVEMSATGSSDAVLLVQNGPDYIEGFGFDGNFADFAVCRIVEANDTLGTLVVGSDTVLVINSLIAPIAPYSVFPVVLNVDGNYYATEGAQDFIVYCPEGIPAISGDSPGSAIATIYTFSGVGHGSSSDAFRGGDSPVLVSTGVSGVVYNCLENAVPPETFVPVVLDPYNGNLFATSAESEPEITIVPENGIVAIGSTFYLSGSQNISVVGTSFPLTNLISFDSWVDITDGVNATASHGFKIIGGPGVKVTLTPAIPAGSLYDTFYVTMTGSGTVATAGGKDMYYWKDVANDRWYSAGTLTSKPPYTIGVGSNDTINVGYVRWLPFCAPRSGTLSSIGFFIASGLGGSPSGWTVQLGIYNNSSDTNLKPSTLITSTKATLTIPINGAFGLYSAGISLNVAAGSLYWFASLMTSEDDPSEWVNTYLAVDFDSAWPILGFNPAAITAEYPTAIAYAGLGWISQVDPASGTLPATAAGAEILGDDGIDDPILPFVVVQYSS